MKRFTWGEDTVYVGTAREIRSLYNNLWDRYDDFTPSCLNFAKFNNMKKYGIMIDENRWFTVINEGMLVEMFLDLFSDMGGKNETE